jgi:hypothetical protein
MKDLFSNSELFSHEKRIVDISARERQFFAQAQISVSQRDCQELKK